ncbi:MAG TPA: sorbosone dehydrogenase family protein [Roseiflexaceae bacterium]|nr:sorbosone dehydrogenase family protein [Roseiflexaceae bacterium]
MTTTHRAAPLAALALTLVALLSWPVTPDVAAQNSPPPPGGAIVEPRKLPFSEALARQNLRLPRGFWFDVWATGLGNPRNLVVAPDGTVYVTRREQADVLALSDRDGDGRADEVRTVASGLKLVNGIALRDDRLYLATDRMVYAAPIQADGSLGDLETLIDDLPDAGQHPNRTLSFGPDGKLYISVGSTCNACNDSNPESATLLVADVDGGNRRTFASGLRNTIGFDWHPASGQLWGMDHGSDWRGDDQPPEELNLLEDGGHYGWPWCYADRRVDPYIPNQPRGTTKSAFCAGTQAPVQTYTAHSAPLDLMFYSAGQFPAQFQGDAFVTMRGSWNRQQPSGYKIVRLRFQNGWPVGFEDFMTGFLVENGQAQFGRPTGLAVAPYGSLFVTDDTNGVIYRISWAGGR